MIYRCKELGILNAEQVKYMWKQMNARGIRKKEPLDNAFVLSKPTVLASAALMLIDNKLKLPVQIAEEIVLNADDIEVALRATAGHTAEQDRRVPAAVENCQVAGVRTRPPASGHLTCCFGDQVLAESNLSPIPISENGNVSKKSRRLWAELLVVPESVRQVENPT